MVHCPGLRRSRYVLCPLPTMWQLPHAKRRGRARSWLACTRFEGPGHPHNAGTDIDRVHADRVVELRHIGIEALDGKTGPGLGRPLPRRQYRRPVLCPENTT